MRELTVQSFSDTNTEDDRMQIQQEFQQLKDSIKDMTQQTTWNTKLAVETHYPAYAQMSGNRTFSEPIKIIDGYNNELEIVVGGASKKVTIPSGIYTVEQVADVLEDPLADYGKTN
jgi:flagellin